MTKLVLLAVAAGVAYVLVSHLRNRGKAQGDASSSNGSLGGEAHRAVGDVTERIGT